MASPTRPAPLLGQAPSRSVHVDIRNKNRACGLDDRPVHWCRSWPVPLGGALPLRLQIELVYDPGCPNVDRARDALTEACRAAEVPAVWTEWSSEDPRCPGHVRNLGSPSVLVNEEDVAPGPHPWTPREEGEGPRSRVYRDGDALVPAPPVRRVLAAITAALRPSVG